jgi:UPF0755 protein
MTEQNYAGSMYPQAPRHKRSFRLLTLLFFVAVIVIIAFGGLVFASLARNAFSKQSSISIPLSITVSSGETTQQLAAALAAKDEIPSAFWLQIYFKLHPSNAYVHAGTYVLPAHTTIRQIVLQLQAATSNQTTIRIIEGATINDIATAIASNPSLHLTKADVITAEQQLAGTYGYLGQATHSATLEGYLFPDTYFVSTDASATDILQKMLDNESTKITPAMLAEIQSKNLTPEQVITVASLIEKEIGTIGVARDPAVVQQERQTVAGIIYNRLNKGMALQLDSTKDYMQPGQTTADPSYNTYVINGLPPGPISNPSLNSIQAAINPIPSDYIYFITDKNGTAHFASTIQQQDANIAEYLDK